MEQSNDAILDTIDPKMMAQIAQQLGFTHA